MDYNKNLDIILNLKSDQKIALLGLGEENRQFLSWLIEVLKFNPSQIILADLNLKEIFEKNPYLNQINFNKENLYQQKNYLDFLKIENLPVLIFKSPGIWSLKPELVEFRNKFGNNSILSSLVFFFEKFRKNIIGITGTKGKSTTSSLVNFLINNHPNLKDFKSYYCGNTTNISPYKFWTELDQEVDKKTFFVIETSSFQLQDLGFSKVSPAFGIITNYFVDHLDQHQKVEEYWDSKDNLFKFQEKNDFCIAGNTIFEKSKNIVNFKHIKKINQDLIVELKGLKLPFKGLHNLENLALAIDLTNSIQKILEPYPIILIEKTLQNFVPLPHRLQKIKNISGKNLELNFFDDGYASEPNAVLSAVKTLTEKSSEFLEIWIGGKDKGGDTSALLSEIVLKFKQNKIYKLNLFSILGERVKKELEAKMSKIGFDSFEGFVDLKKEIQQRIFYYPTLKPILKTYFQDQKQIQKDFLIWLIQKDINQNLEEKPILNICLSPGGSSFDEFKNVADRCNFFIKSIKN